MWCIKKEPIINTADRVSESICLRRDMLENTIHMKIAIEFLEARLGLPVTDDNIKDIVRCIKRLESRDIIN